MDKYQRFFHESVFSNQGFILTLHVVHVLLTVQLYCLLLKYKVIKTLWHRKRVNICAFPLYRPIDPAQTGPGLRAGILCGLGRS